MFWTTVFWTSTREFSCLLVGEASQGRGSDEWEEALIHLIPISKKMPSLNKAQVLRYIFMFFLTPPALPEDPGLGSIHKTNLWHSIRVGVFFSHWILIPPYSLRSQGDDFNIIYLQNIFFATGFLEQGCQPPVDSLMTCQGLSNILYYFCWTFLPLSNVFCKLHLIFPIF